MNDPLPEQPSLTLDATLAREALGWQPRRSAQQAIAETVKWYNSERTGTAMRPVSLTAIDEELAA
jgi:nucleoside-diphosphate-sugar epimerase